MTFGVGVEVTVLCSTPSGGLRATGENMNKVMRDMTAGRGDRPLRTGENLNV